MKRRPFGLVSRTAALSVAALFAAALAHCGGFQSSDAPSADAAPEAATDAPSDGISPTDGGTDSLVDGGPPCVIVDAGPPGTLDPTYQNGLHFTGVQSFAVRGGTIDRQGRVHVVGFAGGCIGVGLDLAAVRLGADGALDTSYGSKAPRACVDFGADDLAWAAAIDDKGRLVAAGVARTAGTAASVVVVRFDATGKVDTTFNPGAGAEAGTLRFQPPGATGNRFAAFGLALDGNYIIVVGGDNDLENGQGPPTQGFVVRLTEAGAFDPSFAHRADPDVIGYWAATHIGGGRVLVVGPQRNTSPVAYLVRLFDRAGSLVSSFGNNGTTSVPVDVGDVRATDVGVSADGAIFVSGTSLGKIVTARFDATGKLDTSFGSGGIHRESTMRSNYAFHRPMRVQCDGRVVLGGDILDQSPRLVRLTRAGALDPTFASGGSLDLVNDAGFVGYGGVLTDPRDGRILFFGGQPGDPGPWVYRVRP